MSNGSCEDLVVSLCSDIPAQRSGEGGGTGGEEEEQVLSFEARV